MNELALPGVEHDLSGETLILSGNGVSENLDKVKEAIKEIGFGYKDEA